jgi:hypothetical protein
MNRSAAASSNTNDHRGKKIQEASPTFFAHVGKDLARRAGGEVHGKIWRDAKVEAIGHMGLGKDAGLKICAT